MSNAMADEAAQSQPKKKDKKVKREKGEKKENRKHRSDSNDEERSSKKRKRDPLDHNVHDADPPAARAIPDTPSDEVLHKKHKREKRDKKKSSNPQHEPAIDEPITIEQTATTRSSSNDHSLTTHTPFHTKTTSFYLPLSPAAYAFPTAGLCAEHLSPHLLTYYPPLRGVLLSYTNVRLSSDEPSVSRKNADPSQEEEEDNKTEVVVLAKSINEYAPSFLWLTADFLIFRPSRGTWMEGYVNLQNESLLGMVCYNYFNAVVERDEMPEGWRWMEDGGDEMDVVDVQNGGKKKRRRDGGEGVGWWVDEEGKQVDGRIVFRVVDFEATEGSSNGDGGVGTISILGSLKSER